MVAGLTDTNPMPNSEDLQSAHEVFSFSPSSGLLQGDLVSCS